MNARQAQKTRSPCAVPQLALYGFCRITVSIFRIHLRPLIEKSFDLWGKNIENKKKICELVLDFIIERQRTYMKKDGMRYDLIDAVFAGHDGNHQKIDDLITLRDRVETLKEFTENSDDGDNLLASCETRA